MRIDGIHIKNFLSFDTLEWPNLDPHLHILVGPNGSGKTNLIQTLRAVKDVVNPNPEPRKSLWPQSAYRGSDQVPIEIGLDIQFTDAREKKLLTTFLSAVLCNDSAVQNVVSKLTSAGTSISSDRATQQARLSALLQEQLLPEDIEWLFAGRLIVVYRGVNTWTSWYESRSNAQSFRLNLDGFSFYDDSVMDRCLQILTAKQDQFPADAQLLLNGFSSTTPKPALRVEYSPTLLVTHQAFQQLIGTTLESARLYGASFVFHLLLERALVFSENIRSQPQYEFSSDALHEQPIDLSSGEQLSRYLFLKKNGSQTEREQYKDIYDLFSKITGRSFDVGFDRSARVPARPGAEEKSKTVLSIHVSSDWGDVPLPFSGAGRAEALFICALIASRNEQVILLDEPALNMHVMMQKALLNELQAQRSSQNQFLLITHSPTLVLPAAVANISRFALHRGSTHRYALDGSTWSPQDLASLAQELHQSTDARALLFSRGVILVEGPTEQGALPVWFEKQFNSALENKDIVVYSVGSDTHFGKIVKFLHQFHIPWAIICDGKVIGDRIASGEKSRIVQQLEEAGIPHISDCSVKDFPQLCRELEEHGVFTHARDVNDEIEALPIIQCHQREAKNQMGRSKVRQGQYIATNYDCPDEIAHLLVKAINHLEKQGH